MFTTQELKRFVGVLRMEENFLKIQCHSTHRRLGESCGILKVSTDGKLEIDCRCFPECPKVNLSPIQFGRHIGKNTAMDNWKNHVRVMDTKGKRVPLKKTCLLRYYTEKFHRPRRSNMHRDEFIRCSKCNKQRRFSLRDQKQCRIYHDASLKQDWQCSDMLTTIITCDDAEERNSRKSSRGCPRNPSCKGCVRCVCLGCSTCRFEDCECRSCREFYSN
ncbi:unnamed protein product [Coffea canephora]|uniref:SAND domain-containing protein n=1 Tax=Coffea canephora TaxID=49390 RepID=A0A068UHU7_COFCA|nr:unnamed protein product [Coffea canephora]